MNTKKDYKTLVLPPKYVPKKAEGYMSVEQKAFFYQMLMAEKEELESEIEDSGKEINLGQKLDSIGAMDECDAATLTMDTDLSIKIQERNTNQLRHIKFALQRLEEGTYGYSVISGDEIGLKRLMARPVATTTTEEREASEK